jgi:hypothetical protein
MKAALGKMPARLSMASTSSGGPPNHPTRVQLARSVAHAFLIVRQRCRGRFPGMDPSFGVRANCAAFLSHWLAGADKRKEAVSLRGRFNSGCTGGKARKLSGRGNRVPTINFLGGETKRDRKWDRWFLPILYVPRLHRFTSRVLISPSPPAFGCFSRFQTICTLNTLNLDTWH